MTDDDLRRLLAGGDRRSVGNAGPVAEMIAHSPPGIAAAVRLMGDDDPVVAMRAADALEKATRNDPALLAPHKGGLLGDLAEDPRQEVRWHLLQMLPRLPLTSAERAEAFAIAVASLSHPSRIVAADALSALFALSAGDGTLGASAVDHAERLTSSPSAAVRSRARRLLSARGPG